MIDHHYAVSTTWTGNRGTGTESYRSYGREHLVEAEGKHEISGSADTPFRGDADRWNPEEMLLGALSQCHLLSYLYVAATNGVVVTAYSDSALATMVQTPDGGGHLTEVTLRPTVTVASADMVDAAQALHDEAATKCFIASSVNFPVLHEPRVLVAEASDEGSVQHSA